MKCKLCNQEGFKNPREIVVHRKTCSPATVVAGPAVYPEVETQIENNWQQKIANPEIVTVPSTPVFTSIVEEVLSTLSLAPLEVSPVYEQLQQVFQNLKTADGKSAVGKMLANPEVRTWDFKQVFDSLIHNIMDGDERAIIRQFSWI